MLASVTFFFIQHHFAVPHAPQQLLGRGGGKKRDFFLVQSSIYMLIDPKLNCHGHIYFATDFHIKFTGSLDDPIFPSFQTTCARSSYLCFSLTDSHYYGTLCNARSRKAH